MKNTENTDLRQAEAVFKVEGVLSEKNLEFFYKDDKKPSEDTIEGIRGELVVQTSEINFTSLNVYINKLTKDGRENKTFKGMVTVMNNYQSVAEVGSEEASRVRVTNGQISPNTYYNDRGEQHIIRYQTNFINRLKAGEDLEPKAEFEIEIYINGIRIEVNSEGEDTGRVIIDGLLPTYNGIEPISLIAPSDIADDVRSSFEAGQTAKFYGDIVNSRVVKTVEVPVAIGKPRVETKTTYKNELVITGASQPYEEGISVHPPYNVEAIRKAMVERETMLEEKKSKAESKNRTGSTQSNKAKASKDRVLPF